MNLDHHPECTAVDLGASLSTARRSSGYFTDAFLARPHDTTPREHRGLVAYLSELRLESPNAICTNVTDWIAIRLLRPCWHLSIAFPSGASFPLGRMREAEAEASMPGFLLFLRITALVTPRHSQLMHAPSGMTNAEP